MATSREDRKKELLAEGTLLRDALAIQIQTAIRGPNAITKSIRLVRKIKAIGIKPFAIGGGVLGLFLLKPWRLFSKKKPPVPVSMPAKETLTTKLVRYAKTLFPVARFVIDWRQSSKTSNPSVQVFSVLLEKINSLLTKKSH